MLVDLGQAKQAFEAAAATPRGKLEALRVVTEDGPEPAECAMSIARKAPLSSVPSPHPTLRRQA